MQRRRMVLWSGRFYVERPLLHAPTGRSWPIPDSDQVHISFIQMAAPLMGRNVTVRVTVAF